MNSSENTTIDVAYYQLLVDQLADFIEMRFGVYLDTIMGFQFNLEDRTRRQAQTVQTLRLSLEELDKNYLIRGNGPPSSNLEECRQREIHRMTQASFKKNNSPGGANYDFAIENCLSDIFNYWNIVKEKLGFKGVNDIDVFPVTAYMRGLRNRVQHDLYGERVAILEKGPISIGKTLTLYLFPTFEIGQTIRLSEKDIEAIVFEVRAQFNAHLIPYINDFLRSQVSASP
jgi:hypothetical protein